MRMLVCAADISVHCDPLSDGDAAAMDFAIRKTR